METLKSAIVLVEPQGPLNIGSVCRVMKNFGLSDLRLVTPQADHLSDEARHMAVKSTDILENAKLFPNLETALKDCRLSIGTTRRFGKYREEILYPDQLADLIPLKSAGETTALVFGREDHGLSNSEIDLCQALVSIPTHEDHPSMNLAQAVAVCVYEIARQNKPTESPTRQEPPARVGDLEAMYMHMRSTLLSIGYLDPQNPDHILRTYRRIFSRAELDEREVRILQGLWSKIDWLDNERYRSR